jgi:hypothetical protein
MDDPYLDPPAETSEADALLEQFGRIAVAVAGALVMAFLGAGLGSWLQPGAGY